jgi:Rrf2 family protein
VLLTIEAILRIALNDRGQPLRLADALPGYRIPARYLEVIFQRLVRDGILNSVQGAKGGYILAKRTELISLGDILTILSAAQEPDGSSRPDLGQGRTGRAALDEIQSRWISDLAKISVSDLVNRARGLGISS